MAVRVGQEDAARAHLEQVLRASGDALEQRLEIQRRRDLPTYLRELGGLERTPLRLAVELRIPDRGPDVGGDRGQEPCVCLAEAAFLIDALDADDADRLVAGKDRHAEVRLGDGPDAATFH